MATYSDLLKDVRWQKKRLESLEAADWGCENCGTKTNTLHVHHKRYIKGRKPWEYDREELAVLCEQCHRVEHDDGLVLDGVLACAPLGMVGQIAGLAAGYLDAGLDMGDPALMEQVRQMFPMTYELGVIASLAESRGVQQWREFVRDFAAKGPVTPTVRNLIDVWDEAGK